MAENQDIHNPPAGDFIIKIVGGAKLERRGGESAPSSVSTAGDSASTSASAASSPASATTPAKTSGGASE